MSLVRARVDTAAGRLAFGGITGVYANVGSAVPDVAILLGFNTTNKEMTLSLNSGTTDWGYIPPGSPFVIDLGTNDLNLNVVQAQVKSTDGVAPASGAFSMSYVRRVA